MSWCEQGGLRDIRDIRTEHVAAYVETMSRNPSQPWRPRTRCRSPRRRRPRPSSPRPPGASATAGVSTAASDIVAPAVNGGAAIGCVIAAGTVVPAQLVTAASSDYGGAVVARVARDVLGADGCLGIQAGSTLVGNMGAARDYGQERGEVVFEALHTLDGREVNLASPAGDVLGMGGVPGDGLNILLGHGGRAIDEWARQALERKPSITLDPLKTPVTLTVIITHPITL